MNNPAIYILQFAKDGSYYVGSTSDLPRRLRRHSEGHTQTTRNRGIFSLVFSQPCRDMHRARQLERKIKSWKRRDFIEKIIAGGIMKSVK